MLLFRHRLPFLAASCGTLALLSALLAPAARAADVNWLGTAAGAGLWFLGSSWVGGKVPGTGDVAVFGTAPVRNVGLLVSENVAGLRFAGNADPYAFATGNGSILTLGASGIQNASATGITQTIGVGVQLSADATFSTGTAGAGNTTISGAISGTGSDARLTKTGTGTLTLTNAGSSVAGAAAINGGTLAISGGGKLGNAAGFVGYNSGSTGAVTVSGGERMGKQ